MTSTSQSSTKQPSSDPHSAKQPSTNQHRATSGIAPRDLINIGVFTAIYFVVTFVSGMVGMAGPAFMFAGFLIGALVNGSVVMLFMARTPVKGAMTIMGIISGLLMVLSGHVWYTVITAGLLGFAADAIVRSGGYQSRKRDILAYGVFTLWIVTPLLPIVYQADAYFIEIGKEMGQPYAESMRRLFTPWIIAIWTVVAFLFALFSAWVGTRILDKHFKKAGIA
ncbi:MAG: MptD family putative ECF transporter S component [Acidipropionibacterium sp.]|nr:MptD family putative ECF transporter S component [Acidipropionibacterium sp.]